MIDDTVLSIIRFMRVSHCAFVCCEMKNALSSHDCDCFSELLSRLFNDCYNTEGHERAEVMIDIEAVVPYARIIVIASIIFGITYATQYVVFHIIKRASNSEKTPLPGGSILANIARVTIWLIGLAILTKTCFNYDLAAFVTALGVGGIAVSLGFQDTLLNLIGGLQVSLGKMVEPGDYIEVLGQKGRVVDISWRHTTIVDASGNTHAIPNSLMNRNSLIDLGEEGSVQVPFVVPLSTDLDHFTAQVSHAVHSALAGKLASKGMSVVMRGNEAGGITGEVVVHIKRQDISNDTAVDTTMRAIDPILKKEWQQDEL